eukprot:CAMPEP_0206194078 /NCGR_PEP_ID=MMETSP0166-20121206/6976_1 /ASSEMBLY_ACC=CAM_ASM_000260 /TAXON_ID=95228 /ORGANISM="Vannella robusta, Strain DIVA3 518/3/11/1/6" /LENGTH=487 /DNA_ID=CAMNT_0053610969 /DNA_START=468 /DNA_END=1928 /DNA_ORIENTATION=+
MLSPLAKNWLSGQITTETLHNPPPTSRSQNCIKRKSVREKVEYYETLCAIVQQQQQQQDTKCIRTRKSTQTTNNDSYEGLKHLQVTIGENKENTSFNRTKSVPRSMRSIQKDKIQPRKRKFIETEVELSSDGFREKPVECIQEEKERRQRKIVLLERKVSSEDASTGDSIKQGNITRAKDLFGQLEVAETQLAQETASSIDSIPEASEEQTNSDEMDERDLLGDLWGGIVEVMANTYCVDDESTWRTFSSYSVVSKENHSVLALNDDSSLHADMFQTSEEPDDWLELDDIADINDLEFAAMYEKLDQQLRLSKEHLVDARGEVDTYRARLYEALHQLAKTQYQVRVYEGQLLQAQTEQLTMERTIAEQRITLDEFEKQEIQREIQQLREETTLRRKQVEELRRQIRNSVASLPLCEQTELMVEDPFIECSIRMLDNNHTPLQRISLVEAKLSTLVSHQDIRIRKKKSKKKRKGAAELFSPRAPKFFS